MELSEGEKIIQEAIRRKKEDEKRERKCNQELKKWDEVYKEIVSRYENVKESQETLTFQEYCLKQWMRKNGVELKICKITDAKVQNYLDEQAKNNAKNNKAEDPEYNLDVREKREKIGKEIKKKLKIIIGNEYKKLVTMIADKTLLTASNMVFFDLLLYMLYPVLYSDNARSKGISDGYFSAFPAGATVGEVLDDFFANGTWENYEQDGVTFVHYSGECVSTQTGEKATVGIYFKLNDDGSFEIDRMTMDGETMNLLRQNITLSEISNSYCNDHGIASSNALDELENALDDALADSSSSVSMAEPESETYTEDTDSDNSAQTATRSDRKVVSTNGMDTYSELSGEISVDVNSYEFGEMPESTKEYYLSYGSDFKTAWLNAMYTDVYEYSGKYSNLDALSRFIEYLKFYDEATDYMEVEGMIQDLHEIWYDFDIETLTEEDAGVYVDRVIQMAEANGAEIQIW